MHDSAPKQPAEHLPSPDVSYFDVDDAGVLFDERAQRIYALNTSSAFIWRCLQPAGKADDAVAQLQQTFGLEHIRAREFVATAIDAWRELRLFSDQEWPAIDRGAQPPEGQPEVAAMPSFEPFPAHRTIIYELLDSRIEVRFESPEQWQRVGHCLAHLEGCPDSSPTHRVAVRDAQPQQLLYVDEKPIAACANLDELAPTLYRVVDHYAIRGYVRFMELHAGVVGAGDGCVLLPGASGSGKSCLTAGLVHAGRAFLSDECAVLEGDELRVRPFPLPMCIKPEGWEVLQPLLPGLPKLAVHRRPDGQHVRYLAPPGRAPARAHRSRRVKAIVFPTFTPGSDLNVESLANAEALARLLENIFTVDTLTRRNVSCLIDWIRDIDCFAIRFSRLDDAVHAVLDLT